MEAGSAQRRLSPAAAAIIFVFALLLVSATIWLLRLPIQLFIIATLVALALSSPVNWLQRRGVPRIVAVIAMLVLVVVALSVVGAVFIPRLVRQGADLVQNLPTYWDDLRERLTEATERYPWIQQHLRRADVSQEVSKWVRDFFARSLSLAVGVAGGVVMTVLLLITVVFMLANPRPLVEGIIGLVPEPYTARAREIGHLLVERVNAWLRGLIILGTIVGVVVGIGLWQLGVPYAVLFGVLAGLLEMVPTVGPVLSAIPPILVALALEPIKALWVALLFIAVQQLENTFLVPFVMGRQLQLHPVSVILGFVALGSLFGLFGAIVAVPTVACLKVLYCEVYYPWAHPSAKRDESAPVPAGPPAAAPDD